MIPILYERSENVFRSNGLGRLLDCIGCTVTEVRNGEFTCQFTYPVNGPMYSQIELGRFIGCTHDVSEDTQPFMIYRREANLDGTVTFYAQHVTYELNYIVRYPFAKIGASAVFEWLNDYQTTSYQYGGYQYPSEYTFETDITDQTDFVLSAPTSIRSMLGGMKGSILETYGGEYEWDRYGIFLHADRGKDNGATIRYGGNLTGAQQVKDISEAYGTVVPYWVDKDTGEVSSALGVYTAADAEDDDYLDYYPYKAIALDVSGNFETAPASPEVEPVAMAYLEENKPYLPFDNISINFVPWSDAEIAAESERLQNVQLCDYVRVDVEKLGIQLKTKVTKTVWNVLLDRYDSIELGDLNPTYASTIGGNTSASSGSGGGGGGGAAWETWREEFNRILDATIDASEDAQGYAQDAAGSATIAIQHSMGVHMDGTNVVFEQALGGDKLKTVSVAVPVSVSSGNRSGSTTMSASTLAAALPAGYAPLGIVGVMAHSDYWYPYRYYINGDGELVLSLARYTGTASSATTLNNTVYVLCIRSGV